MRIIILSCSHNRKLLYNVLIHARGVFQHGFEMINNVYSCTEPAFDAKANAALSIINLFLIKGRESGLQSGDVLEFGRRFLSVCQRLNFNHEFIMLIIRGDAAYFVIFQFL